jgi:hypothetical protein
VRRSLAKELYGEFAEIQIAIQSLQYPILVATTHVNTETGNVASATEKQTLLYLILII